MKINRDFVTELRKDFQEWSGGFAPESPEQIEIYIQSAMSIPDEDGVAKRLLENWMNNPDKFERKINGK